MANLNELKRKHQEVCDKMVPLAKMSELLPEERKRWDKLLSEKKRLESGIEYHENVLRIEIERKATLEEEKGEYKPNLDLYGRF